MQKLQGISVSPGIVIGEAVVMANEGIRVPRQTIDPAATDCEVERFRQAVQTTVKEIVRTKQSVVSQMGAHYGAIFDAHFALANDPALATEIEALIQHEFFTPEYAVTRTLGRFSRLLRELSDDQLAQRAFDIEDIEDRLLQNLLGRRRAEQFQFTRPAILLAHNLTVSEAANLKRDLVLGFATEIGGAGSHTAIVAEALGIPAIVGAGDLLASIGGGETVIIDGEQGIVILNPDDETKTTYQRRIERGAQHAQQLTSLRDLPAETQDGTRVELFGTIEFPHEVDQCLKQGGEGIGLYRTEFLYLGAETAPDEETHFQAYRGVLDALAGKPVVARTFDLGADKFPQLKPPEDEHNPCLGLRSLRLALRNRPMFRTQLRALLKASGQGDLRLMFPLVATLQELRQAKTVLADVMEDLEEEDVSFNRNIKVGMMVEIPSAVVLIRRFLPEVDFISVGSNDLTQYALAVDRDNKEVARLFNPCDPAVLSLMSEAIQAAQGAGIPASICGQICNTPRNTMLLLGLGFRQLSVSPAAIPYVKRVCRGVTVDECQDVAQRALAKDEARDVEAILRSEWQKRFQPPDD
ncbi:MAG: phosphoenolpyruvate--protein phosphotransferase [Pirellulales bacterium]|nr:phosphoenolpyruvate--protein phosphotransferase [Pirellulales bacterium]